MKYDPLKHHRHSIRLKGYDYSQAGAYFVTMVTHDRECLFGEIEGGAMRLNEFSEIVSAVWLGLPMHFRNVELDEFVVMPNHLHGIVVIVREPARRGEAFAQTDSRRITSANANASPLHPMPQGTHPRSLNAVVQNFKSVTARRLHQIELFVDRPIWQRNYYEHIVRDEHDLERIRAYIAANPARWEMDEENPAKQT